MKQLKFKNVSEVTLNNGWVKFKRNNEWNIFHSVEYIKEENDNNRKNIIINFCKQLYIPFFNVGDFIIKTNNNKETCLLVTDIREYEFKTIGFSKDKSDNIYGRDIVGTFKTNYIGDRFRFATIDEINEWYEFLKNNKDKLILDSINSIVYHIKFDNWYKSDELVVYNEEKLCVYNRCGCFEDNKNIETKEIPNEIMLKSLDGKKEFIVIDFSKIRRATKFEKQLIKNILI